jgi:Flp pilus assembly protein TadG
MHLIARKASAGLALLRDNRSGIALVEFAYGLPAVMGIGMYGLEVANLAQTHLRVSQVALSLADNASRVGVTSALNLQQIREVDINDVMQAARLQSTTLNLPARGRITLSSLEQNAAGGQWVHWQRCLGIRGGGGWDSSYGAEGTGKTGTTFAGMGKPGEEAKAPPNSAVMFVEVNFEYKPLVWERLVGKPRIHYTASYVVRDKRDLDQAEPYAAATSGGYAKGGVYNPNPKAEVMSCDKYTT